MCGDAESFIEKETDLASLHEADQTLPRCPNFLIGEDFGPEQHGRLALSFRSEALFFHET